MNSPTKIQIEEGYALIQEKLEKRIKSEKLLVLPTLENQFKMRLCTALFLYLKENKISNKSLSEKTGIQPSVLSKITNFKINEISTCTILELISLIDQHSDSMKHLIARIQNIA